MFTTDNRRVNRIASELGRVDSDDLEIHRMGSRAPDLGMGHPHIHQDYSTSHKHP